jgi:iron complex transport system substrate-binding protein
MSGVLTTMAERLGPGMALLLIALLWAQPAMAAKPQRIVSTNVCTDQLLLSLVEPERILSLSYLSVDPRSSAYAAEAAPFPKNRGGAEAVLAMRPDLVVTGTYARPQSVALLRRFGVEVVTFDPAASLADVQRSILKMGKAVSEAERAAAKVARIDAALAALPPVADAAARPVYADYGLNGWTSGDGSLIADLAAKAGLRPYGDVAGFTGARQVSLEQFLTAPPDIIDIGDDFSDPPTLSVLQFRHPALRAVLAASETVSVPAKYTLCGTVRSLAALDLLVAARLAAEAR